MTVTVCGPALHGPMDGMPMSGDPDVPLYAFPVVLDGDRVSTVTTDRLADPAFRSVYCLGLYAWDTGRRRWRWHPVTPVGS